MRKTKIVCTLGPASASEAIMEEMPVLVTPKTAYEVCVLMGQAGIQPPVE